MTKQATIFTPAAIERAKGWGGGGYKDLGDSVNGGGAATSGVKDRLGSIAPNGVNGALGTNGEVGGGGINRDKWLGQLNPNPALKEELYRRSLGENSDPTRMVNKLRLLKGGSVPTFLVLDRCCTTS
jgi:hypothetical protein